MYRVQINVCCCAARGHALAVWLRLALLSPLRSDPLGGQTRSAPRNKYLKYNPPSLQSKQPPPILCCLVAECIKVNVKKLAQKFGRVVNKSCLAWLAAHWDGRQKRCIRFNQHELARHKLGDFPDFMRIFECCDAVK